jgi:ribosomal-protein-alanine N-acetyltransferase
MTTPILETERLVFNPFTSDDLPLIVELHSDPEVQRFLGGDWAPEVFQGTLDRLLRSQAEFGFTKWKVTLKDGAFVGRAGSEAWPREGPDRGREAELGYALKRAFWGQGLATEAAAGARDWFFANTSYDHLIGFTEPDHEVSQRVLLKIGMRPLGLHDMGFGEPSAVFRVDRPAARG